jgi:hypothetical protein
MKAISMGMNYPTARKARQIKPIRIFEKDLTSANMKLDTEREVCHDEHV